MNESFWKFRDMGTLSSFDYSTLEDCNLVGQAIISGLSKQSIEQTFLLWDNKKGSSLLCSNTRSEKWIRVNKNGQAVGIRLRSNKNGFFHDIVTWSKIDGFKVYHSPYEVKHHIDTNEICHCRNSEVVYINRKSILKENDLVYSLQNNVLKELTPLLKEKAEAQGFKPGGWLIFDVNEKGMLLGKFIHYEINPYKNTKNEISTHYFILDNEAFYLIDWPEHYYGNYALPTFDTKTYFEFDASGQVFFCFSWTYNDYGKDAMLWNRQSGLQKIECPSILADFAEKKNAISQERFDSWMMVRLFGLCVLTPDCAPNPQTSATVE